MHRRGSGDRPPAPPGGHHLPRPPPPPPPPGGHQHTHNAYPAPQPSSSHGGHHHHGQHQQHHGQHQQPHHHHRGPPQHQGHPQHHRGHHQHHRPPPPPADGNGPPAKWHSFKLLVDPLIHHGAAKMVRYDGMIVPGNPHHVPPMPSDPRKKLPSALWRRLEAMEMPVPRMKVDENYVGEPPRVEVTIENLNDNVGQQFLTDMIKKYGPNEEMIICHHPVTKKHLGLARIVFVEVRSAKECVAQLHGKSVMGKQLNCYLDPSGASFKKMFQELTEEKKPEPPPLPESPDLPEMETEEVKKPSPKEESSSSKWDRRDPRDRHHDKHDRHSDHRRDRRRDRDRDRDSRRSSHHREDNAQPPPPPPPPVPGQWSSSDDHLAHPPPTGAPPPPAAAAGGPDLQYQPTPFDPQYSQPEYWLQQAQRYAEQAAVHAHRSSSQDSGEAMQDPPLPPPLPQNLDDVGLSGGEGGGNGEEAARTKEPSGDGEDSDHQVDLDTRLKMLMKDRTSGVPAFLLHELNGSESEPEEGEMKEEEDAANKEADNEVSDVFKQQQEPQNALIPASMFPLLPDEVPLSRPPSPFLSSDSYLKSHRDWLMEKRNVGGLKKKKKQRRANSRNSDQMSLSSLSSAENNILEEGPSGSYPPHLLPPSHPGYYYQGQEGLPPPPHGWTGQEMYDQYGQPYSLDPNLPPHMAHGYFDHQQGQWVEGQPGLNPYEQMPPSKGDTQVRIKQVLNESVDGFVKELKRTLHKDINKRMCETFAFFLFDKWWQEQEEKYKERMLRKQQSKSSSTPHKKSSVPVVFQPPDSKSTPSKSSEASKADGSSSSLAAEPKSEAPTPKAEDLASLFDKQREKFESGAGAGGVGLGMGGSLGFGFRGTIPKLPSFKRKSRTSAAESRRKRGDDSSDDEKPSTSSSSSKKMSEKRKEQERRREQRREKEKDSKAVKDDQKASSSKAEAKKKPSKTLDSIYSALYSGGEISEGGKTSLDSDSDTGSDYKSAKAKQRKDRRRRSLENSAVSSSVSESSAEESEVESAKASSSDTGKDVTSDEGSVSSANIESESSSSSSSEAEAASEEESKPKVKVKPKAKALERKVDSSEDEKSEDEPEKAGSSTESDTSDETERRRISIEEQEEAQRRPTPQRRPSAIKTEDEATSPKLTNGGRDENMLEQESPPHISDHCYAKPSVEKKEQFDTQFANDHGYTRPRTPPGTAPAPAAVKKESTSMPKPTKPAPKRRLSSIASPPAQQSLLVPRAATKTYKSRTPTEQFDITYKFLTKGLDLEDISYLKRSYEMMLNSEEKDNMKWINEVHWVPHCVTDLAEPPPKKKRKDDFSKPHLTGSCRTEGYYKMDPREKARTKYHLHRNAADVFGSGSKVGSLEGLATKGKGTTAQSLSREARSAQRRQLAVLGDEVSHSDLLKFNQLKFRRKQMIFGKSAIHDWGLFAQEDIGADEMVIEYVGHVVRPVVSDVREKRYEKQGIGSSYLFRIDSDYVVDATKRGNLARFINHSCDPNCYAKVITVDQKSKIVIYSKQAIALGEEITYDYKFPIEDEKIHCLCGTKNCRKYLN